MSFNIFWDIQWLCHLNDPTNNTVIFWDIQMTQQSHDTYSI